MKRKFLIIAIIFIIAVILPVNACKHKNSEINLGLGGVPVTIDPQRADDPASKQLVGLLYEGLVSAGEDGIELAAASDYQVTDNGLKYIFTLRKNLKWSDGKALVASEFLDGIIRTINPDNKCADAHAFLNIKNAQEYYYEVRDNNGNPVKIRLENGEPVLDEMGAYIPDEDGDYLYKKPDGSPYTVNDLGISATDTQITIELDKPMPQLLSLMTRSSAMPYRKEISEQDKKAPTNGAWKIDSWSEGNNIKLIRNKKYHSKVQIETINCIPVSSEASIGLIKTGDLNVAVLPRGMSAQLDMDTIQTGRQTNGSMFYMQMVPDGKLKNIGIRKAISASLDREILSATIAGYPATGLIPYNIYENKQSLRDLIADYSILAGDNKYIEMIKGAYNDVEINLTILEGSPEEKDMADTIQQQLLDVLGFTVIINTASFQDIPTLIEEGKCDAVFGSIGPFTSASEYISTLSGNTLNENYIEEEKNLIEDAVYIPLTFGTFDYAYTSNLSGIVFRHDGVVELIHAKTN